MSQFIEYQAPIIIRFELSKLIKLFVRDGQYKNNYEQKGDSIKDIEKQEKELFGDIYDECLPE